MLVSFFLFLGYFPGFQLGALLVPGAMTCLKVAGLGSRSYSGLFFLKAAQVHYRESHYSVLLTSAAPEMRGGCGCDLKSFKAVCQYKFTDSFVNGF